MKIIGLLLFHVLSPKGKNQKYLVNDANNPHSEVLFGSAEKREQLSQRKMQDPEESDTELVGLMGHDQKKKKKE